MEEYNRKLKIAKFGAHRKRMAPETQDSEDTLPSKQQFSLIGMKVNNHKDDREIEMFKM